MFRVMTHGRMVVISAQWKQRQMDPWDSMSRRLSDKFHVCQRPSQTRVYVVGGAAEEFVWRLRAHTTLPEYPYSLLL